MVRKLFFIVSLMACAGAAFGKASTGNCMSKAKTLASSQAVTLVNEWDPGWGEYLGTGVYYFKVRLTKGQSYTIWISGGSAAAMGLDVDTDIEDDDAPFASFSIASTKDASTTYAYMYSDDWDEDDPSSYTYYVCVYGDIGQSAMLYYTTGIVSFVTEGEEENPRRITMLDTQQSNSATTLDGDFYYSVNLVADHKYRLRTTSGTAEIPIGIVFDDIVPYDIDPDYLSTPNYNSAYLLYPTETGTYKFHVAVDSKLKNTDVAFKIKYMSYPTRSAAEHPYVMLDESNEYSTELIAGRLVGDKAYYDGIIDETLTKIRIPDGERWVFWTEGATNNLRMIAYNTSGVIQKQVTSVGRTEDKNIRMGMDVVPGSKYYVGVCNPDLEFTDEKPTEGQFRLYARNAAEFTGDDYQDSYDPEDDVYTGASLLTPLPAASREDDIYVVGDAHGRHTLSAGDWYDWFKFPARAGVTYRLRASYATSETTDLSLTAKIYRLVDGALVKYSEWSGTITPKTGEDGSEALGLTPTEGGMYYVRVSVAEGVANDFPAYTMHAMAYAMDEVESADGAEKTSVFHPVGLVQGKTQGLEGTWFLSDAGTVLYPNGTILALPILTNGTYKVKFSEYGGYTTPLAVRTNTVEWTDMASSLVVVTGRYTDTSDTKDPSDDTPAGYVTITPTAALAKAKRTLWADDKIDYFRFKAYEGYYYNFYLTDTTQEGEGDAVMTVVSTADGSTPVVENVTRCMKKSFAPGKYYLSVTHGFGEATDSCYRLYYSCANVGTVQFSAAQVNVSETAAYVDIPVTRTASDGAVRLNYATVEGTALPGKEYYPTSGILSWEDGDMETKTIRVRLIPDLVGNYEGHERFTVKLWPMTEDCLAEDEYLATIGNNAAGTLGDVVTVKIKEAFAQQPGKLTVEGQPLEVLGGDAATVRVSRTDGCDGRIAVTLKTQNGTATNGVDFVYTKTNLVWEAGDATDRVVTIATIEDEKAIAPKTFKVKLTVLSTEDYADCLTPTLAASKVTVTIGTDRATGTLTDAQKTAAAKGVTLAASGSWFLDGMGRLRSVEQDSGSSVKMKFTANGPGFFIVEPEMVDGEGTLSCTVGGVVPEAWNAGDKLVTVIPAASTLVSFKFTSAMNGSYVSFVNQDNGLPFKWIPLDSVKPLEPWDNGVVDASLPALSWTKPQDVTSEGLWYRVRTRASTTGKASKLTDVCTNGTEQTSCRVPTGYLTAGTTYAWVLDCAISDEADPDFAALEWLSATNVWHFTTAAVGAPTTASLATTRDVNGDVVGTDKPIQLVEGVTAALYFAADGNSELGRNLVVLGGEVPPGLALKATKGRLSGVPSAAGDYEALLQASGELPSLAQAYKFHVAELGTGAGAFRGTIVEDGTALTNGYPKVGYLTFSATKTGAISAKAKVGTATYSFSSTTGYDELLSRKGDESLKLAVALENISVVNNVTYTNTLAVTIDAGSVTNLSALCQLAGKAVLSLNVPDENGLGAQKDIAYTCDLYRDSCGENAGYDAMMAEFAGYYTVALTPEGVSAKDGVPCGNGYLTLTVATDGTVTGAGKLSDGTDVSLSSFGQLVSNEEEITPAVCQMCVPVLARVSPNSVGGVLKLSWVEPEDIAGSSYGACTVDSRERLVWNKDGKYSTYDRQGFSLSLRPVGGWYNTVVNLQTYYLNYDFAVEAGSVDALPEGIVPAGYAYTVDTMPSDVEVLFESDALTAATRVLAVDEATGLYDLAASVNPWKVKTSFNRATGVVTGSFKAWSDDGSVQAQFATLSHYGVLLMKRDAFAPIDPDLFTVGFYLMPVTSKWTLSMPFNIRATGGTDDYRDWSEAEIPVVK